MQKQKQSGMTRVVKGVEVVCLAVTAILGMVAVFLLCAAISGGLQ